MERKTVTKGLVAVRNSSGTSIHLPYQDDNCYTLCGIYELDYSPESFQVIEDVPAEAKVNCQGCFEIWKVAARYNHGDFEIKEI